MWPDPLKILKWDSIYIIQEYLYEKKSKFSQYLGHILFGHWKLIPYSIRLFLSSSLKSSDVNLLIVMIGNGRFSYVTSCFKCAYSFKQPLMDWFLNDTDLRHERVKVDILRTLFYFCVSFNAIGRATMSFNK